MCLPSTKTKQFPAMVFVFTFSRGIQLPIRHSFLPHTFQAFILLFYKLLSIARSLTSSFTLLRLWGNSWKNSGFSLALTLVSCIGQKQEGQTSAASLYTAPQPVTNEKLSLPLFTFHNDEVDHIQKQCFWGPSTYPRQIHFVTTALSLKWHLAVFNPARKFFSGNRIQFSTTYTLWPEHFERQRNAVLSNF